jgi:hypothetical protein
MMLCSSSNELISDGPLSEGSKSRGGRKAGITRVRISRRILPISITDSLTICLQPAIFAVRSFDCGRKVETVLVFFILATC